MWLSRFEIGNAADWLPKMRGPDHASAEPLVEPLLEPGQLEHVVLLLRPLQNVPGLGGHPEVVNGRVITFGNSSHESFCCQQ